MYQTVNYDIFHGLFSNTEFQGNEVYQSVLFAQYALETGFGKSNLYCNYNNLYGMKPSSKRTKLWSSTVILGNETFATYDDDTGLMSLLDRIDLDKYNQVPIPTSKEEVPLYMASVVAKGYATDPNYFDKWQKIYCALFPAFCVTPALWKAAKNTSSTLKKGSVVLGIFVVLASLFFFRKRFRK